MYFTAPADWENDCLNCWSYQQIKLCRVNLCLEVRESRSFTCNFFGSSFKRYFCTQLYYISHFYILQIICTQLFGFKYDNGILRIIWFQIYSHKLFTNRRICPFDRILAYTPTPGLSRLGMMTMNGYSILRRSPNHPVGWVCRLTWLHFCRGVIPHALYECPG